MVRISSSILFSKCNICFILGNQLWKKFPTKLYRDYVKTEETCYEIVQELINEIIEEGIEDDGSPLSTILLAKELKDQEKIAAVVGKKKVLI